MQYLIIANPTAGRGRTAHVAKEVHQLLQQSGTDSCLKYTATKGDAEAIARTMLAQRAEQTNQGLCVVACGGDGTIQEVVNALMTSKHATSGSVVLGLAPGGRCNDFASAFGIRSDARQIGHVLLCGQKRSIDVGRVGGRYFCTVATMGFDTAVSRFVNDMKVPLTGTLAYVYGVLRVLPSYQPVKARLILDDSVIDEPLFLAASANTSSYGGRLHICPGASAGDGVLDLCLVSPVSRWRILRLLHRVLHSRHADLPEVRLIRTRCVRIEADTRQEIWADGEFITETPVTVEVVPDAIQMLVPNDKTS